MYRDVQYAVKSILTSAQRHPSEAYCREEGEGRCRQGVAQEVRELPAPHNHILTHCSGLLHKTPIAGHLVYAVDICMVHLRCHVFYVISLAMHPYDLW